MHYAYLFITAAVVGMFTISGMAGSYSRMLLKTAHFDQVRQERDVSRKDYAQLEQVAHEKDVQAASLGSLASEISVIYGLRKSSLVTAAASTPAPASSKNVAAGTAAATAPLAGDSLTADGYKQSLDEFLALRTSALNGSAARSIVTGLPVSLSSADSIGVTADLDNAPSLWPVQGPITSSFGEREDPFNGEGAFHKGVDISAVYGTPIRAAADGVVESATMEGGYGRQVLLDHGHGLKTLYAHMSGFTVTLGQSVIRGQVIGYVGSSGRSTGAHLHYEVQIHGTPVNPHKYLRTTLADLSSNPAGL